MKISGPTGFGLLLITCGLLFLIGNVFGLALGKLFWPALFILLGIWLLRPPQHEGVERSSNGFIQDLKRNGDWVVENESFHVFIGDLKLDLTEAVLPPGETTLYFSGFIADIKIRIPEEIGVKLSSSAFINEVNVLGQKRGGVFAPAEMQTTEYKAAEKRLHIVASHFISDVKVTVGDMKRETAKKKAGVSF